MTERNTAMMLAVAETIQSLGSVPAGHLYARVMGFMDHETFETIVTALTRAKMIERKNHLLTWIGQPRTES